MATMRVRIPSRMKIHDHPPRPPTPLIFPIANARIPPNAPAAVAAEKKSAILRPHSCRAYHLKDVSSTAYVVYRTTLHRDVICHTWEKTTFTDTEESTNDHESSEVLHKTHADR